MTLPGTPPWLTCTLISAQQLPLAGDVMSFVVEDGERLSNAEIMSWLKTSMRAAPQSPQAGEVVGFGWRTASPLA